MSKRRTSLKEHRRQELFAHVADMVNEMAAKEFIELPEDLQKTLRYQNLTHSTRIKQADRIALEYINANATTVTARALRVWRAKVSGMLAIYKREFQEDF